MPHITRLIHIQEARGNESGSILKGALYVTVVSLWLLYRSPTRLVLVNAAGRGYFWDRGALHLCVNLEPL